MSKEMLTLALTTKEASVLAAIRSALNRSLRVSPAVGKGAVTPYVNSQIATEALKSAIGTSAKKNLGTAAGGSFRRAAGAGLAAGTAIPVLESLGLSQSSPLMWGLSGGAGVLGHDLAGWLTSRTGKGYAEHLQKISCARRDKKILLQKLGKYSKGRKKRAAMVKEGPYKKEYSLTKQANLLARAGYLTADIAPTVAGSVYGGRMGANLLPENPIIGRLLGAIAGYQVSGRAARGLSKSMFPKSHKYFKGIQSDQLSKLSSHTKQAGLSRAAKGAIAAPLGIMGAAAVHPELFGHVQNVGILDSVAGRVLGSLDNLAKPVLGDTLGQSTNALASLGGLSALGAGAGKLSERLAPVAKKSFLEDPRNRKMLLAASLFPWVSTAAGATYLVNKAKNSDS